MKKLLAMLLAAAMVISLVPVTAATVSAATPQEAEVKVVSATPQDSLNRYLITLDVEDTITLSDRFWNNNTVYIDGKDVSGEGVHFTPKGEGNQMYFVLHYDVIEADAVLADDIGEHVVVIPAGTAIGGSGGGLIMKNELKFKLNGSFVMPYGDLEFVDAPAQEELGRFLVRFTVPQFAGPFEDVYWDNGSSYLWIDGEQNMESRLWTKNEDGSMVFNCLYYNMLEEGATSYLDLKETHEVIIKEESQFSTVGSIGAFVLNQDVKMTVSSAGVSVENYTPIDMTVVNATPQEVEGLSRFVIEFDIYGVEGGLEDHFWNDNTVYIDGAAKSGDGVHYSPNYTDNDLALYLSYDQIKAGVTTAADIGNHALVIPKGTILGDIYILKNDVVMNIDGTSIIEEVKADVTQTFTTDDERNKASTTDVIYLKASSNNLLKFSDEWNVRYSFYSGGVSIDGTPVPGAKLLKLTNDVYYIALDGTDYQGVTFTEGTVITVGGIIKDSTKRYAVNFAMANFVADAEGSWTKEEHTHMGVKTDAVEATCTTTGNIAYWTCSCGLIYADEACTEEITLEATTTPVAAHTEEVIPGKAPTCKATGLTDGKKCSVCGETLAAQETIAKIAHKEVVVKGKVATSTSTGLTDGKQCSVCKTWTVEQKVIAKIAKPGASKITKATGAKKKITIKFKKVSGINGYEIQIATKKNMKKGLKTFTVKASKAKYVAKKLKAKTKYWVRIRTYKVVNGTKYTSSWSKKVTVKTK